jgi:Antirepressor regulating drug resistance, predicted signal transduction N-terminal membrane component
MTTWIVTSSILIIAVLVLRAFTRKKISRRMQYAMWGLVLIRLLMPFSILNSHVSIMNFMPENTAAKLQGFMPPVQTQTVDETILVQQKETKQAEIANDNSKGVTKSSNESKFVTIHKNKMTIPQILQLIWIIGGVLLGIWFISANTLFFIRIRKERIRYEKSYVKLPVYLSERVVSPCLFGVIHPSIYLTYRAVEEGVCTEHVITHELCHYRHGDQIWSLMRGICLAIWWWNPLVWLAAVISKKDAEMACDEAAIQSLGETERLGYGRTLVDMIAVKKKKNMLYTATTMTSGKKEIKERLDMIIKNPKVVRPAVVGVAFVILVISICTFTGALSTKESQASIANVNSDNQIPLSESDLKDASQSKETAAMPTGIEQSETIELQALYTKDLYEGGKLFEDIDESFAKSFPDKVAAMKIPDARKGERATSILETEHWDKGLVFLNSLPEKNIYLYGYNDMEHLGEGLILDIGKEQHIYSFPYRYTTTTSIGPSISASNDGSKIYVFCATGTGTGRSISELYIFQVNNNEVESYYVDINKLVDLLTNKLGMTYDTESKTMTIYSEGKQIATDTLIGHDGIPKEFYCGDFIGYKWNKDVVEVICDPTINLQNQVGIPSYLKNVSFEADINFKYDSNGKIIGFDIGELAAVKKD